MNLRRTLLRWTFRRGRLPWWAGQLLDFDPEWVRVLNRLTRGRDVDRAHFWSVYNLLPMEMQPIALSWFDRHVGLQEGEIFYFQETTQRMWLHSDPAAWGLDCSQVWTWLEKVCPHRFESCYLLAGYEYATLTEELKHQILSIQATYVGRPESLFMGHLKEKNHTLGAVDVDAAKTREAYYHWALLFAMGYRMSFKEYADDWLREEEQWVHYYVNWPENVRVYILEALSCLPLERCQGFLRRHLRTWFPHAVHVIDAAEAIGEHPARVVLTWLTETRNAPEEISLAGVL